MTTSGNTGTAQIGVTGLAVMRIQYRAELRPPRLHRCAAQLLDRQDRRAAGRARLRGQLRAQRDDRRIPRRSGEAAPVLIMVEAGDPTDAVINELADAMEEGDIIIDGGNALYTDTIRREKAIRERGPALRRRRHLRWRGGRAQRPVDHARRPRRVLRLAGPAAGGDLRARRRRAPAAPTSAPTAPGTS